MLHSAYCVYLYGVWHIDFNILFVPISTIFMSPHYSKVTLSDNRSKSHGDKVCRVIDGYLLRYVLGVLRHISSTDQ
jgi:hypothetical protein